ncbi:MAG: DUF4142 domain-containing protein [Sphingobacteriales bacterium]|nr:MAG: DUF4142 domain-containing protein [Sphingobacteriales bacterium]
MSVYNIATRLLPVIFLVLLAACDTSKRADKRDDRDIRASQKERGVPETGASTLTPTTTDQVFVTKVIDDIDWLIVWLNAGLMKSTDTRLRTHAEAMLADHHRLLAQLATYAYGEGYNIPKVDTGNIISITRKMGNGWDKEWAAAMAEKQQDLIKKLEQQNKIANTTELKNMIEQTLPILYKHADMTTKIRMGK